MTDKAFVDLGGNIWVDIMSITVVQPRTIDGDARKKVPGCTVFLAGDTEPVHGEDDPTAVIQRITMTVR